MPNTKVKEYVKTGILTKESYDVKLIKSKIPDLYNLQERMIPVNDIKVQLIGMDCNHGTQPEKFVLIIPGNPGQGMFYVRYVQRLFAALHERCDVYALTLPGFETQEFHGARRRFSLQDHINSVTCLVQEIRMMDRWEDVPVSIIGHSIGAYIGLHSAKLLADYHKIRMHSIIAMLPFFRVDHTNTRQRIIRFVCYYLRYVPAFIMWLLNGLPRYILYRMILALGFKKDVHNVESMILLIHKHVALNALYMGKTEFVQLNAPTDWKILAQFQDRLAVIAAPNDDWFSREQYEEMQQKFPSVPMFWEPGQCHAFVVSDEMCVQMAQRTVDAYDRISAV